ncbi:hypothetical protein B566_EDAN013635 [Ephemera danica]|nr:hypothetical protein B566_EDAN013635 [Ephemera danica]
MTTLTQEKRALQLQNMSRENSRESSVEIREVSPPTVVTIQGLERISECTEPSRESSADGLVDVTEPPSHCTTPAISRQSSFEEFEECEEVQKFTLALPSSEVPDRNFLSSPPRGNK